MATPSPLLPPPAPTIPLAPAVRAAFEDLNSKIETAIEATADPGVLQTLNAWQQSVHDVLTKDNECKLHADTALFAELLKQINNTNDALKALKDQLKAIAGHIAEVGAVIGAVNKVITLVAGA